MTSVRSNINLLHTAHCSPSGSSVACDDCGACSAGSIRHRRSEQGLIASFT